MALHPDDDEPDTAPGAQQRVDEGQLRRAMPDEDGSEGGNEEGAARIYHVEPIDQNSFSYTFVKVYEKLF